MTDYTELVKTLRTCLDMQCRNCKYADTPSCRAVLNTEAADAIEELSRIIHEYQKFDGFLAAHGMFKQEPMKPIYNDEGQLLYYPST